MDFMPQRDQSTSLLFLLHTCTIPLDSHNDMHSLFSRLSPNGGQLEMHFVSERSALPLLNWLPLGRLLITLARCRRLSRRMAKLPAVPHS